MTSYIYKNEYTTDIKKGMYTLRLPAYQAPACIYPALHKIS